MTDAKDAGQKAVDLAGSLDKYLPEPVKIVLFTSKQASRSKDQRRLLEDVVKLSSRISLEVYDVESDREIASRYAVDEAPCTAILGKRDFGLRFYGVAAGHEFSTLIEAVLMVGNGRSGLAPALEDWVRRIDTPTHIEVFVTLTCPVCPRVAHLACQMAMVNDKVRADVVVSDEFPGRARAYDVRAVPLVVVNGRPAFQGLLTPEETVLEITRIAAPDVFEELEALARARSGASRVLAPVPGHVYDAIVVGAGPAAMSAAIYAVRKGLDVLIVGDRLGGQISDTAAIENWLGVRRIGGHDLAVMFRAHMEHYQIAESLHTRVSAIERQGDAFVARVEDGTDFRGRTLIYCAGKQYRTLGVPGEAGLLGRGIAFCATCDAPLYTGKRVAVIGGGNSAFTAARDLVRYAAEIHLVNPLPDWQADAILQAGISDHPKVMLHPATRVVEFIGVQELTGVRLESVDGGTQQQLSVDGAFLEIGLIPNSGPVAALVPLNAQGEILVNRDQSTSVPGLFAAGDVTDEPDKQIVVAEGAGAKAGLAAANYLASIDGGQPGGRARGSDW